METKYKKYPRTMNTIHSQSESSDDVWLKDYSNFEGNEVVVTSKQDGQCTTLYDDFCHARSVDSMHSHHESRSYIKQLHASIKYLIPEGVRICGEDMYAKHSIYYPRLTSYFYVFAVFDAEGTCLSWDGVVEWGQLLGLETVPVLYRGIWDEQKVCSCWPHSIFGEDEGEGYVVRNTKAFPENEFKNNVGKFVRPKHVTTGAHWMNEQIVPNGLSRKG